eukprot:672813-Prymnesium_polylepis.1
MLRAVKEMVEAGLLVQKEGDEVGKEARERLSEENRQLARVRKLAMHWRKRVLVGGPARAEELRQWQAADGCVRAAVSAALGGKGIDGRQARGMRRRLQLAVWGVMEATKGS